MHTSLRSIVLLLTTAAATGVVVTSVATAQAPAAATAAPQMVVGLPDFTHLVDQVGPAVVNIEANVGGRAAARGQLPDDAEIPEFFRRFFGPGMPTPPGGRRGTSQGTGFIISTDGYVLTNHHVVDGADEVRVRLTDRREFTAKVIGSDEQSDVALLKVNASALPALRIGDSKLLKPGQWVVAIGSPFGLDHSVTAGIVSAVGRANPYSGQRYVPFIQTDVAINRGNSGGPLLDTRGQVVGINSQIFSNSGGYMGVSFAIPIDVAMSAVQQLKTNGRVTRGQLGVQVQEVTRDMLDQLSLTRPTGALVAQVLPGSAAAKAGIEPGDVITAFNGRELGSSSELPPQVGAMAPGSRAKLTILRDGKPRDVAVVLSALDEAPPPVATATEPAATHANPLGIVGEDLAATERRQLGLDAGEGVAIARIEGLAARRAGLQPGDVILAVGRTPIGSRAALDRALRALQPGQATMLLVRRGNATQYVAVTPREQ